MLEGAILDNTERLLSQSPYFASPPRWTLMHQEASAGTKYQPGLNHDAIYNEVLDLFLFQGNDAGTPLYRFVPDNFYSGTTAVVQDSALVLHDLAIETTSGRVWGLVNNASGNDGLYRRDPSVATPNWTKIVSSANSATLAIWRKTNGELWYNDATAGNWYLLSNGAAGSAQVGTPTGLSTSANRLGAGVGAWNIDFIAPKAAASLLSAGGASTTGLTSVTAANAETWGADLAGIFDTTAAPSATNLKAMVPFELAHYARFPLQVTSTGTMFRTLRLSSTYSLIVCSNTMTDVSLIAYNGTAYSRMFGGDGQSRTRHTFALLNKVTGVCRYLGVVMQPLVYEGITYPGTNDVAIQSPVTVARLKNSELHFAVIGNVSYASGAGLSGILFAAVPLAKLDF